MGGEVESEGEPPMNADDCNLEASVVSDQDVVVCEGVDATADCLDADSERLGRSRQPTSATKQPNGIGAIRTPWRCSDEYVAGFR